MATDELRLPLLDQLIDDDPGTSEEAPPTAGQTYRQVIDALKRDLLDLLNTRERCLSWPKSHKELDRSILSYGIPDITGANLAAVKDRDAFLQSLAPVIRRCDPRYQSVRIVPAERSDSTDRILRFRIEAAVKVESGTEAVAFDLRMEPITRLFAS